jgi:hypothetical protein
MILLLSRILRVLRSIRCSAADDADEANLFASTLTTRGDLLAMGAGPDFARIGIGAADTVLTSDGTDAAWAAIPPSVDIIQIHVFS